MYWYANITIFTCLLTESQIPSYSNIMMKLYKSHRKLHIYTINNFYYICNIASIVQHRYFKSTLTNKSIALAS